MDRQHILKEIRRTALVNGGVPLGTQRFAAETGIKRSDWLGRFWARWGDALTEAGFRPNAFQESFDVAQVASRYLEFARELGRLPVEAELRMKGKADPSFPSHSTFRLRLGNRDERRAKLLEYCQQHPGFDDLAALCVADDQPEAAPEPADESADDVQMGFVYLLKSGRHYKLGRSNAFGRRERELAIQLPQKADTVHVITTDDPPGIEAYWHNRFGAKRANGEWFELDFADVKAFRRRKFM